MVYKTKKLKKRKRKAGTSFGFVNSKGGKNVVFVSKKLRKVKRHSVERDKLYEALPSGKRITESGSVYYEYRENRADRDARKRL